MQFAQKFFLFLISIASLSLSAQMSHQGVDAMMKEAAPTVIHLSQTEGVYETTALNLVPGDYIFEVTNRDVDKELGFYLQDKTDAQVANSGLESLIDNGQTSRTGVVTLTEGEYRYSCPLNPTPHYAISVGEPRVITLSQIEGQYEETSLSLTAGYYIFEVSNRDVDKELGFYLQDETDAQVANSGLESLVDEGQTSRTGVVYLAPGRFRYSCPLNPTPHYTLDVK